MRHYSSKIALIKNGRGVYSLDPSIGCSSGLKENTKGCYNDCYAAKLAKLYGYDFSKTVYRDFDSKKHLHEIIRQISLVKLDFIRMGTSGDPSENWEHTMKILRLIKSCNKQVVIITKHWNNLTLENLNELSNMNIVFNTSVSSLDNIEILENTLFQYEKIKGFCKSILRVVTCDFNKENETGLYFHNLQETLLNNENVIETVLRVNKNNPLVKDEIINVSKTKFLGKNALVSKRNKKTYLGNCKNCLEMCGLNKNDGNKKYNDTILHQLKLF